MCVCGCLRANMFLSRTNGVRDASIWWHRTTISSSSPPPQNKWGIKTLFHEFFRQAVLLALKSLSCAVVSCILNEEKHTGQNATDLKCRCKDGWPGVLLFSQFTQSFSHSPTQEPVMNHEKNWNGGPKNEHGGQNREDARGQHPLYIKIAEHIGLVKLHWNKQSL